ncbi:MAG: hypothetical protein WBW94_09445 [Anaerolineales bacterium]
MTEPKANDKGSFETVLPLISNDWPYALPHLYAINIASDPGIETIGWIASPDGENIAKKKMVSDRSKVEQIGFWHNEYKITRTRTFLNSEDARQNANESFKSIPTKYLMQSGKIIEENGSLVVTGDWPFNWHFSQLRDIGVFLCYLQILLQERNEDSQAQQLRDSITPAWPPTEVLLVFQKSLQLADKEFSTSFDNKTKKLIGDALKVTDRWLYHR